MYGVLSDSKIKNEIKNGNIILYDPTGKKEEQLIQNSSVDVTIGEYYYTNTNGFNGNVYNPWREGDTEKYWNCLKKANIVVNESDAIETGLSIGSSYIKLQPGENILAHTEQFIGGKQNITTMMKGRSSMGRCNIEICGDAGWGDIGYVNRWTMEIKNKNKCTLVIPVGSRVAQIIFLYTGFSENVYNGKYQTQSNINDIISTWKPESMLPKCYADKSLQSRDIKFGCGV